MRREALVGQIPLATLLVLGGVLSLASDHFLTVLNLSNLLVQAAVISVVAMGMTFVILGGGFDLSVGSIVALSGVVGATAMMHGGIAAGVAAGVGAGALVGALNGFVVSVLRVNPFITTLGSMVLVRGAVFLLSDSQQVPIDGSLPQPFLDFGVERFLGIHWLVWLPIALLVVLSWVLAKTPYGRAVYATGGNREAAYLSGIAVDRVVASTYVWSGALSGVAGIMLCARLQSGQPTAGEFYELTAIAAVVLGGAALQGGEGRLYKTIIGVFIMLVLGNGLNLMNVDSHWQRVAVGLVIIAAAAAGGLRLRR